MYRVKKGRIILNHVSDVAKVGIAQAGSRGWRRQPGPADRSRRPGVPVEPVCHSGSLSTSSLSVVQARSIDSALKV